MASPIANNHSFLSRAKKINIHKPEELEEENKKQPLFLSRSKKIEKQSEKEKQSFAQELASSTGTQAALGLTQALTSPLDLAKMYLIGEGLAGIEEAEEASYRMGKPFDRNQAIKNLYQSLEYFPTQTLAEELLEKKTGISTQPKGIQKFFRGAAEFLGLTPKAAAAKIKGLQPHKLAPEQQALKETAEEFGLRKFAGLEKEKPPTITPIVSLEKQAKITHELGETSKKAIDDIISQKIPVKKMRDMGINLENAYETAYTAARKTASDMGEKPVDFSNVVDWINSEVKKTKSSAPSLSNQQKTYIQILEKEKKSLIEGREPKGTVVGKVTEKEIPAKGETVVAKVKEKPIYESMELTTGKPIKEFEKIATTELAKGEGPRIDLITGKPIREFERKVTPELIKGGKERIDIITGKKLPEAIKNVNANQALNQYQNFNNNVKGIWKKPEFSGSESTVINAYARLNDKIIDAIGKSNPALKNELKFANNIFHETSKLEQVEGLLNKSFKDGYDPKKLARTLSNKRERKYLERNLGKDSVIDLERIAKYGKEAQDKVLVVLKNPKTAKEYLNTLTPGQLALIIGFKGHAGLPMYMTKAAINRAQGMLFTRNATRKNYIEFLKNASHLGSPAFIMSARKLSKSVEDEFGSEDELFREEG